MSATPSDEQLRDLLRSVKSIAVLGIKAGADDDAFRVPRYMQAHGYRIVPVNPTATEILGERCYPSVTEAAKHHRIDMVDCFRKSEDIPPIADEAIAIGAKCLWCQFNVISEEGARIAEEGGLIVVMDRCMKVEHARFVGRMHWLGFNTQRITSVRGGLQ